MDYQIEYYDIEEFWDVKTTDLDLERIQKVSQLIPPDVNSILDAGCGNGIFTNYLNNQPIKYSRVHGVDRSSTALQFVKTEKTQASLENLPFQTDEFDLVACLEVLEHLPNPIFEQVLIELTRVSSKYIIISVPNKQNLEVGQVRCSACMTKFNPDLHLNSFSDETLRVLLTKYGYTCKKVVPLCEVENYSFISDIYSWKSKFIPLNNVWTFDIICPVCGKKILGNKNLIINNKPKNLIKLIKKTWPKKIVNPWLVAIYEKTI